jgi:hypothetical protein
MSKVQASALYALIICIVLLYWPVSRFDFVNYDDPFYVTHNSEVQAGLTAHSVKWAFKNTRGFYHPITWLSLMFDETFFGTNPASMHLVNVAIHCVNTVLLLVTVVGYMRSFWLAMTVAALFAMHPVNVESVAWVSERKGLLAATFLLAAVLTYRKATTTCGNIGFLYYITSLITFILSLLCKPIGLFLPVFLFVSDMVVLKKFSFAECKRSLFALIPFFQICALLGVVAITAESSYEAIDSSRPVKDILANVLRSYALGLSAVFYPDRLTVYYPYETPTGTEIALSLLAAASLITALVIGWSRAPLVAVGVALFVLVLLPASGLVPIGDHSRADRYLYLPCVGLLLSVVWVISRYPSRTSTVKIILAFAAISFCIVASSRQINTWKDSKTLFAHALSVREDNYVARINYGTALAEAGDLLAAEEQFTRALALRPNDYTALYNLALTYRSTARFDQARAITSKLR